MQVLNQNKILLFYFKGDQGNSHSFKKANYESNSQQVNCKTGYSKLVLTGFSTPIGFTSWAGVGDGPGGLLPGLEFALSENVDLETNLKIKFHILDVDFFT